MKKLMLFVCLAFTLNSCSSLKILPSKQEPDSNLTPQQFKAAWEKSTSLAPQHELLKTFVGSWKTSVTSWMDPDSVPRTSEGSTTQKLVLNGRFLLDDYHGDFEGKKFSGIGLLGYDSVKEKYISNWADSMGTSIFESEGSFDQKSQTLTLVGTMLDPASKKIRSIVSVTRFIGPDNYVFEMYDVLQANLKFKTLEIVYSRVK